MQLMEEALAALEIWKALFRSTCPTKLVVMTVHSMAHSKRPGMTALSGYPTCIRLTHISRPYIQDSPDAGDLATAHVRGSLCPQHD